MGIHILIKANVAPEFIDKGSIYGKASKTPSPHSFREPSRGNRSLYSNRTTVLSKEAIAYTSKSHSIITHGQKRDPTTT